MFILFPSVASVYEVHWSTMMEHMVELGLGNWDASDFNRVLDLRNTVRRDFWGGVTSCSCSESCRENQQGNAMQKVPIYDVNSKNGEGMQHAG